MFLQIFTSTPSNAKAKGHRVKNNIKNLFLKVLSKQIKNIACRNDSSSQDSHSRPRSRIDFSFSFSLKNRQTPNCSSPTPAAAIVQDPGYLADDAVRQAKDTSWAQNAQQFSRSSPSLVYSPPSYESDPFLSAGANFIAPGHAPLLHTYIIQRNRPKILVANSARCTVTG